MIKPTGDNGDFSRVKHRHTIGDSKPRTGVDERFVRGERRAVNVDAGRQLIELVLTVVGAARPRARRRDVERETGLATAGGFSRMCI